MSNSYKTFDKLLVLKASAYRDEPNHLLVKKPTKPGRARALGYKANGKFVVIRSSISKGGIKAIIPSRGRKHPNFCKKTRAISHEKILENRALKKFPNLQCIGSYKLVENGKKAWYEYLCLISSIPK